MTASDDGPDVANEPTTPEELEADIVRTRDQLGRTVEALSARLDVKARLRDKVRSTRAGASRTVARVRQTATDDEGESNNVVPTAAALVAVALGAIVMAVVGSRRS